jgi:hypothetical protein
MVLNLWFERQKYVDQRSRDKLFGQHPAAATCFFQAMSQVYHKENHYVCGRAPCMSQVNLNFQEEGVKAKGILLITNHCS